MYCSVKDLSSFFYLLYHRVLVGYDKLLFHWTKYWLPFVKCFTTSLNSNLRTALTTKNNLEFSFIVSHAQNTTSL
jgi:hypothetical protein